MKTKCASLNNSSQELVSSGGGWVASWLASGRGPE